MKNSFFQKRWLDFRNGHSIYLAFALNFVNFILITYNFAIEKVSFLSSAFDSLMTFTLFLAGIYIPLAMAIGYWHRRRQYSVENEALLQENWIWAWIARYQIRLIEGKTTSDESKEVVNYLEAILRRQKKDSLLAFKQTSEESQDASEQRSLKSAS